MDTRLTGSWPGGAVMSKAARPKSAAPVSLAGFYPPAAAAVPRRGCRKPNPVRTTMQATIEGLGKPQDSFAHRLADQEQERRGNISKLLRLRKEASAEIHRLIAFLD